MISKLVIQILSDVLTFSTASTNVSEIRMVIPVDIIIVAAIATLSYSAAILT